MTICCGQKLRPIICNHVLCGLIWPLHFVGTTAWTNLKTPHCFERLALFNKSFLDVRVHILWWKQFQNSFLFFLGVWVKLVALLNSATVLWVQRLVGSCTFATLLRSNFFFGWVSFRRCRPKLFRKLFLQFHRHEPGLLNSRKTEMSNGIMPVVFHVHLCRSLIVVPGAWVPNSQMPKALLRNANTSASLG